jgi:uncharacterized protein YneF (UPF0154 family)
MIAALVPYLITGAACLLAGSALGYYTAHADIERQARDRTD